MRVRKCCDECSRRRKKVTECRPRGPGRKCWSCAKWVRECSFVEAYPEALLGLNFELSREERQHQRAAELRALAVAKGLVNENNSGFATAAAPAPTITPPARAADFHPAGRTSEHSPPSAAAVPSPQQRHDARSGLPCASVRSLVLNQTVGAAIMSAGDNRPQAKKHRTNGTSPQYELAAAAANAAASALEGTSSDQFFAESEAAAATLAPKDAAHMALVAWAAASAPSTRVESTQLLKKSKEGRLELLANTAQNEGVKSLLLHVPSMMCGGSCGAAINRMLQTLPQTRVAGINVKRRLVHCHTPCKREHIIEVLNSIGFEATVISVSTRSAPLPCASRRSNTLTKTGSSLAAGSFRDSATDEPVYNDEWEIADALGLISTSCSRREGEECNCGPSCMCHYCPTHHPDRAHFLLTAASEHINASQDSIFAEASTRNRDNGVSLDAHTRVTSLKNSQAL